MTEPTRDHEPTGQSPVLRIEVLGRFRWSVDDQTLPAPSPVGMAALAYLLVHAGESIRHEEMEALFTSLAAHDADAWVIEAERLSRLLPRPLLRVTPHSIRLTRDVMSDVAEAASLLEPPFSPAGLQRAWLLLRSEFLESLSLSNRPIWNVWLRARRARLHKHLLFVTEQLGLGAIEPAIQRGRPHRVHPVH